MKIYMIIILFLLLGAFFVFYQNNLKIAEKIDVERFGSLYLSWLGHVAYNSWQTMGYAVKLDWLPDNTPLLSENITNSSIDG